MSDSQFQDKPGRSSFYVYTDALQKWLEECRVHVAMQQMNTDPLRQVAWRMAQEQLQQQQQQSASESGTRGVTPGPPAPPQPAPPDWANWFRGAAGGIMAFAENVAQGDQPPANVGLQGLRYKVPPLWKRLAAEFVDYLIVFLIRALLVVALAWRWPLRDVAETIDLDLKLLSQRLHTPSGVEFNALELISPEMMVAELLNRVGVAVYEAMCITFLRSRGGVHVLGTPGKWLFGLRVVTCAETIDLPEVIEVVPGNRVPFFNAVVRSLIKNLAILFFLPVCITAIFFRHHRATYDILASTIVVECAPPRPEET